MDDATRYNIERWKALVDANALFTRPALNLDPISARARVDPEGRFGSLAGKNVLCLASGGGQQSVAFALLGANVTVFDLSDGQLRRDQEAAAHYGVDIQTRQGDMRDLSSFEEKVFDIVYQPYSLGFVPDARTVFHQVARVVRINGLYQVTCANPFFVGLSENSWNGTGYTLKHPYINGAEVTYEDQQWVYDRNRANVPVPSPREYRHTLSALVSGLVELGFVIIHVADYVDIYPDTKAEPGTWEHFVSVAPPWLTFLASYRPGTIPQTAT